MPGDGVIKARGSRTADSPAAHLLAAMTGAGQMATQLRVPSPRETVHVLTDLTSRQASPERLAKIVRSQWTIENRLHFVRDTTFTEDASKIRTGHGPENMATLRNFAINRLRAAGRANIAAGLREMSYEPFRLPHYLLDFT